MRRSLTAIILFFSLCLGVSAEGPHITIGGLFNLTGRQAFLDVPASRGAQLAADQANSGAKVINRDINLVLVDTESDLAKVKDKTVELLSTYVRLCAVMGFSDTDFVLASAPLATKQRTSFVTPGATSPRLPKEVSGPLYLACFGDNVQAAAAAEYATSDLKAKTAFVIYDDSTEYTRLLQQYFVTRFQELGGKVVGAQGFDPDNVDRLSLKAAKADVIFLSAGPQQALPAVRRLRQLRLRQPILGGDSFDSDVWVGAKDVSNVFYTTHAFLGESNTRPQVVQFRKDFQAKYPGTQPDAFAALGYDSMNLLLAAIRSAGSTEPDKISAALGKISGFQGVTGTISFTGDSHIPNKTVSLVKLEKGKPGLAREILPQSVPKP